MSTNLGPWVNRRGLFAREAMADTFKSERIPSTFNWEFSPKGQHIELGIAENNLFILLSALGLMTEGKAGSADDIRELMSGNICRCGAYTNIVAAIEEVMREKPAQGTGERAP